MRLIWCARSASKGDQQPSSSLPRWSRGAIWASSLFLKARVDDITVPALQSMPGAGEEMESTETLVIQNDLSELDKGGRRGRAFR
jgi:hypothetical protein